MKIGREKRGIQKDLKIWYGEEEQWGKKGN